MGASLTPQIVQNYCQNCKTSPENVWTYSVHVAPAEVPVEEATYNCGYQYFNQQRYQLQKLRTTVAIMFYIPALKIAIEGVRLRHSHCQ